MEKKECLFSFGKINKYFIIPFLCPIFCFLANYFFRLYTKIPYENSMDENSIHNKVRKKLYFLSSIFSLTYLGGGLLYFIAYIRTKTEAPKKSTVSSSSSITYIYNDSIEQNNVLKIFSLLFIISLLISFAIICNLLVFNQKLFERRLYYLLLLPIFSKIILKVNYLVIKFYPYAYQ